MLSTSLVEEIADLLELGELSHRQIAARLNVSRGTVNAIASGRRGLYGKERDKPDTPITRSTPPARCPRCGYRVYLPCIICRIRELRTRQLLIQKFAAQRPRNVAAGASPPKVARNNERSRAAAMHNYRCG
jgi:hypothetical protein